MKKAKTIITIIGFFLFSFGNMSFNTDHSGGSVSDQTSSKPVQTTTKSTQTGTKSTQTKAKTAQTGSKTTQTKAKTAQTGSKTTQTKAKTTQTGAKTTKSKTKPVQKISKPEPDIKIKDAGTVSIGSQTWAVANLNVSTFRNGDSIPEARTNKEWVAAGEAGKPAWCYYNNDPANGPKYGKLYNWYAVNDPRELAPVGWVLSDDPDWAQLTYYSGGLEVAGGKLKSVRGWSDGNNGTNEIGFSGIPGGYRVENGTFLNLGSIGIWWSTTESKTSTAIDHYLSLNRSIGRSSSPKQRGESVRCIRPADQK
jgi:uncharacterized protein (TIGR02145 family)